MKFTDDEYVETVHDLGDPCGFDYVPKGTRGSLSVNHGSKYPYTFYPVNGKYLPWLVEDHEIARVDTKATAG
jgi:hypothetical protein